MARPRADRRARVPARGRAHGSDALDRARSRHSVLVRDHRADGCGACSRCRCPPPPPCPVASRATRHACAGGRAGRPRGRGARRRLPGSALPIGPPLLALRLGRLGVLGPEGEGDLLLRRPRRAVLPRAREPELPAARAGARGLRVPLHGLRRRRHAQRAVLVLRVWLRRSGRGAARPARLALRPLAVHRPRARHAARGRPQPRPASRLPARLLLRAGRAPRRALARRPRALAARHGVDLHGRLPS